MPPEQADAVVKQVSESYVGWQEASFPGLLGNVVAGRIASRMDLGGTNAVVDAACGSSLAALTMAVMELRTGRSHMVITGGVDTFNDIFMYMCFSKTPALSPDGTAKPYGGDADGTTLGEGVGMVILKRLDDAIREGDKVYAVIKGIGSSSDGKGKAIYAPRSEGQIKAVRRAYEDAGFSPASIGLIEGHGTGTKVGDEVELAGLNEVFAGAEPHTVALGSVKSQVGHTKAAAGVAGLIKATLAIHSKVLPPSIRVEKPIGLFDKGALYLNGTPRPWVLKKGQMARRAGVSAFGFGGSNFHCALEEAPLESRAAPRMGRDVAILPMAGADTNELEVLFQNIDFDCDFSSIRYQAHGLAKTHQNSEAPWRLCLIVTPSTQLSPLRDRVLEVLRVGKQGYFSEGVALYRVVESPKVAWLFPGQGSQKVGMLRDLSLTFGELNKSIQMAGSHVCDAIYPKLYSSNQDVSSWESRLQATEFAQPALGAVCGGLVALLKNLGLRPSLTAGHSFGELTALLAGDVISEADYHRLATERGRLMAACGSGLGGMTAVMGPLSDLENVIRTADLSDVCIANYNAPNQTVVSGTDAGLAQLEPLLKSKGLRYNRLKVGAAFHSPIIAKASKPFAAIVGKTEFHKASCPIISGESGDVYPTEVPQIQERLGGQLEAPVAWTKVMTLLSDLEFDAVVEVGPGKVLANLAKRNFGANGPQILSLSGDHGNDVVALAATLAQLWGLGENVEWTKWEQGLLPEPERPAKGLKIEITGANYRSPQPPAEMKKVANNPVAKPSEIRVKTRENKTDMNLSSKEATPEMTEESVPSKGLQRQAYSDIHTLAGDSLLAMQQLQLQTASLHQQFLKTQEKGLEIFGDLMARHQDLLAGASQEDLPDRKPNVVPPRATKPVASKRVEVPLSEPAVVAQNPASVATAPFVSEPKSETVLSVSTPSVMDDIREVIHQKTGYPPEMIEPQMDLEADLGIDSIKRVEIFSALQESHPAMVDLEAETLSQARTIQDIGDLLGGDGLSNSQLGSVEAPSVPPILEASPEVGSLDDIYNVIAEKTGYPANMLNGEMDLEADLGIDSIKKVEIFSRLQEVGFVGELDSEQINGIRTLNDIAALMGKGESEPEGPEALATKDSHNDILLKVITEKTGYPADILTPNMALEADLGVDSIKKVEILSSLQELEPGLEQVPPETLQNASTIGDLLAVLQSVGDPKPEPNVVEEVKTEVLEPLNFGTVPSLDRIVVRAESLPRSHLTNKLTLEKGARIWVTDDGGTLSACVVALLKQKGFRARLIAANRVERIKEPEELDGLILMAPDSQQEGHQEKFIFDAFRLLRLCSRGLRNMGRKGTSIMVTVSRNDGDFGLRGLRNLAACYAGGLAGLSKTVTQEWPEVHAKAIDLATSFLSDEMAADRLMETLFYGSLREIGITPDGPTVPGLSKSPLSDQTDNLDSVSPLGEGDPLVVTGGARGVTAEVAKALVAEWNPTLIILGRSPVPENEPIWLKGVSGVAEVKKALATHLNLTKPKQLEAEYRKIISAREITEFFAELDELQANYEYHSVDVREKGAVKQVLRKVRKKHGPIRGLVHGAGVLADKGIEDKTDTQFREVFSTKVAGISHLMSGLDPEDLRCLVLFSSSTARYGRRGQVDYGVANEVLNKMAQYYRLRLPRCRTMAINWGPWDGGMVGPGLKKVFLDEGISTIPLRAGALHLVQELLLPPGRDAEVVVLGPTPRLDDWTRGEDNHDVDAAVVAQVDFSVRDVPVLRDHVIQGKAVIPMAVVMEQIAQSYVPELGRRVVGLRHFQVLAGIRLDGMDSVPLTVRHGAPIVEGQISYIPVEVSSEKDGVKRLHYRCEILVGEGLKSQVNQLACERDLYEKGFDEIYSGSLFHGEQFQGIKRVLGCSSMGISGLVGRAPSPDVWFHKPMGPSWVWDPLMVDSAFQLLVLWGEENQGYPNLPTAFQSFEQYAPFSKDQDVEVRLKLNETREHSLKADIEFLNDKGDLLARFQGYEAVSNPSLEAGFKNNRLVESQEMAP